MSEKGKFEPTRWSLVSIVRKGDSEASAKALNVLLGIYWFPLYAFARGSGRGKEDAEDLVQGFYLSLVERSSLGNLNKENGKLRTFLIKAFKNFIASDLRKKYALKRGGGKSILSLDDAESKYQIQPYTELSPENLYDRAWAMELLGVTMKKLEESYQKRNREDIYQHIKVYLGWDKGEETYTELSERTGISVSSIKVEVRRLKIRYKEILFDHVRDTLDMVDDEEIKGELMELFGSVG